LLFNVSRLWDNDDFTKEIQRVLKIADTQNPKSTHSDRPLWERIVSSKVSKTFITAREIDHYVHLSKIKNEIREVRKKFETANKEN